MKKTPRVVEGAEILSRIIHPDAFGEPNEAEAARVHPDLMLVEEL